MKKIITCFLLFISYLLNAQAPQWEWGRNVETNSSYVKNIAAGPDGIVYMTGTFKQAQLDFGDTVLQNSGEATADIYIVKYNSDGDVLWAKSFGSPVEDYVLSITADTWGNFIILGRSPGQIELAPGVTTPGGYKCFIAKFDPQGDLLWEKHNSDDYAGTFLTDLVTDGNGNVYVTGLLNTATLTYDDVIISFPQYHYINNDNGTFVAKFTSSGECVWGHSIQTNTNHELGNQPHSIATDAAGNVYIAGEFFNSSVTFGTITLTKASNSYNSHMYVAKYNTDGVVQWADSAGSDTYNKLTIAHAVTCTNDAVYVSGLFAENAVFGNTTLTTEGGMQMFYTKYDTAGNVQWAKSPPASTNTSTSRVTGLYADEQDNLYITGNLYGAIFNFGNDNLVYSPDTTWFIAKLQTANGNAQWVKQAGPHDINRRVYISAQSPEGIFVSSIIVEPTMDFTDFTLTKTEGEMVYDIFVAKLSSDGLASNSFSANEVAVWPNPVKDELKISGIAFVNRVEVYNMAGQLVLSRNSLNFNESVNLSGLSSGAYVVNIISGDITENIKIIKE